MTTTLRCVLDVSVCIKQFIPDPLSPKVYHLLTHIAYPENQFFVPDLFYTVNIPIPEEIRETYLEVREIATGEVITVIELLSPKNKRQGEGRKAYQTKRLQILGSSTNLVEIDLLRAGESMPILDNDIKSDYRILVSRSQLRPRAELYPFNLLEAIPAFFLPLQKGDIEPLVNLQNVIQDLFDRAGLDLAIDYNSEAVPPIQEPDLNWVNDLLKEQDL